MNEEQKTKHTCGEKSYSTCVYYEKEIPEFSDISDKSCVTLEETTQDIYNILDEIKEDIDLSELGDICLTYVNGGENKSVRKILLKYEEEICELKEKVRVLETESICTKDITLCEMNLTGIVDPCSNNITTLQELLQYLLNKVNE